MTDTAEAPIHAPRRDASGFRPADRQEYQPEGQRTPHAGRDCDGGPHDGGSVIGRDGARSGGAAVMPLTPFANALNLAIKRDVRGDHASSQRVSSHRVWYRRRHSDLRSPMMRSSGCGVDRA